MDQERRAASDGVGGGSDGATGLDPSLAHGSEDLAPSASREAWSPDPLWPVKEAVLELGSLEWELQIELGAFTVNGVPGVTRDQLEELRGWWVATEGGTRDYVGAREVPTIGEERDRDDPTLGPLREVWIGDRWVQTMLPDPLGALRSRVQALEAQVESLGDAALRLLEMVDKLQRKLPDGPANSSAALIRDMDPTTAERAIRDQRPHHAAAADLGVTYAQVYSARLEYTFKKVHAKLRAEGFVNPWARPEGLVRDGRRAG